MERKKVTVYTDGSCKGNPGPGGWGAILLYGDKEHVIRGGCLEATNCSMELTAVVEAVKACKVPCDITVVTDATYVMMTKEQWNRWQKKKHVANWELWQELIDVGRKGNHKIKYQHVDGHTGEVYNERCDKIAREQATKYCHKLLKEHGLE